MTGKMRPLGNRKYYGTIVDFPEGSVEIWIHHDSTPSTRQLKAWGVSLSEALADDYMCDSHYETEYSYQLAQWVAQFPGVK